jgi:hypothetical protein
VVNPISIWAFTWPTLLITSAGSMVLKDTFVVLKETRGGKMSSTSDQAMVYSERNSSRGSTLFFSVACTSGLLYSETTSLQVERVT